MTSNSLSALMGPVWCINGVDMNALVFYVLNGLLGGFHGIPWEANKMSIKISMMYTFIYMKVLHHTNI